MQNLEETIASRLGTNNEVANGLACSNCRHMLNEEHDLENCYGLDFDSSSWISCKCKRFKSGFDIRVEIYEDSSKKVESKSSLNKASSGNLQKTFIPTFKKIP